MSPTQSGFNRRRFLKVFRNRLDGPGCRPHPEELRFPGIDNTALRLGALFRSREPTHSTPPRECRSFSWSSTSRMPRKVANSTTIIDGGVTPVFRDRQLNCGRAMSSGSPTLATSAHTLAGLNTRSPVLRDLGVEQVPVPGTDDAGTDSLQQRSGGRTALRCPSTAPRQKEGDRK